MTAAAPPRSPTRPCAFCGGPVPPTRPAVADQPPHLPMWSATAPTPEGNLMLVEPPTDPIERVTVTRKQPVTPLRPRVDSTYREWLNTPLDQQPTDPPRIGGLLAAAVLLLVLIAAAALIAQVIT